MVQGGAKEVDISDESFDNIQRWTAKRRLAVVLNILNGESSVAEAASLIDLQAAILALPGVHRGRADAVCTAPV